MNHRPRPSTAAVTVAGTLALATALLAAPAARADDFPARKPGLWQMTGTSERTGSATSGSRMCIDAASDKAMQQQGSAIGAKMCGKYTYKATAPGRYESDSECMLGNSKMTTHSVLRMNGDDAFEHDTDVRYDPPLMNRSSAHQHQSGKWVGPCPAGFKPGDVEIDTGNGHTMKMNMLQVMQNGSGAQPSAAQQQQLQQQLQQLQQQMQKGQPAQRGGH